MRRVQLARCIVTCALAVGAGVATSSSAHAAPDPSPRAPARKVVEVVVVARDDQSVALEDTLRELLAPLDLTLDARREAPSGRDESALLARVRIDLRGDSGKVVVLDGRTGSEIASRTVRREGSEAVFREAVAHVVRSSIEPLAAAERAERERAPAPTPPAPAEPPPPTPPAAPVATAAPVIAEKPAPSPPAEAGSAWAIDVATMGGAGPFAPGSGAVVAIGGSVAAEWRRGIHPAIALSARYALPFQVGGEVVQAHASVSSVRLLPQAQLFEVGRLGVALGMGGGIDVLGVEPRSQVLPPGRLPPATTRVDPILAAAISGRLALASNVDALVAVGLDVDLAQRRYVLDAGPERSVVFEPSRVRPMISLGLAFTVAGPGRGVTAGEAP